MKYSTAVQPISYVKAHASGIIKDLNKNHGTMIVTQNGEAKVVIQDIEQYEQTQESLAMLKIMAMSQKSAKEGCKPASRVFSDLRNKLGLDK